MLIKHMLSKRIQYLFCTSQNYTLYNSVKDRLINYPYSDLNQRIQKIRLYSKPKDFLSQYIIQDSIAFAALFEHRQNILINYHKDLLMGIEFSENVSGADIFIRYFEPRLQQIGKIIKNSTSEEEINYSLKILFYLKSSNYKIDIQNMSLNKIIGSGTIEQKAYLLQILADQKNFLSFIQTFNKQFNSSAPQLKEKAAFIIISIPNFHKALPSTLCEQSIDIVGDAIHKKTDWQIYRVMQYIFETDYPATRRLADKIMDHLLDKNEDVNNSSKVPVMIKAIKLRDSLRMDNKKFQEKIKDNPLKFNSIFFKKKINKTSFLQTVASKDSKRILPAEISGLFNSYIIKGLEQIIENKQCDTEQLSQIVKLSLKFYQNIQTPKLNKIVQQIQVLFPMFDESYEILFWLMLLLLRIDKTKIQNPQIAKYALKLIDFYGEESKRTVQKFQKSKNVEKIIELYYQLLRSKVKFENLAKILEIDFKQVRTFQIIIYSCYIINNSPLKNQQKYQMFCKLDERISQHFKQNNFKSLKNLYIILTTMDNSKCEAFDKSQNMLNLYRNIEKDFMRKLFKQNICPPRKDLIFLKKMYRDVKMPNEDHQHFSKFLKFLSDCLDHPSQFKKHYKQYQSSLKNFNPNQTDPRKKKN